MKHLMKHIRLDEGFNGMPYDDTLGIPTIGIGTKLPLTEEEAELIAEHRMSQKINHLLSEKPIVLTLTLTRQEVLFNMAFQLGVNGLIKFKKMWDGIENHDFEEASKEMKNSRWYLQTTSRAEKLMRLMRNG